MTHGEISITKKYHKYDIFGFFVRYIVIVKLQALNYMLFPLMFYSRVAGDLRRLNAHMTSLQCKFLSQKIAANFVSVVNAIIITSRVIYNILLDQITRST